VSFVDICDDYDAAENILSLSPLAEEKGVLGVTGLGWTPGISNLLARKAYDEMGGDVEAIDIWWFGSAADSKGLAVVMHLFYALTGEVPMYLGGRLTRVKAGSSPAHTEFPHVGRLKLYYAGHPEPITIPRCMRVSDRVTLRGGLIPQWQNGLVKLFIGLGLTSTAERTERLARFLHRIEDVFRSGGKPISGVRVDVTKEGRWVTYSAVDRMRRLTSIPASLGAIMILNGEVKASGVHPPETAIGPAAFLQRIGERGIEITRH
jgi:lysine 6-dehydrogenase